VGASEGWNLCESCIRKASKCHRLNLALSIFNISLYDGCIPEVSCQSLRKVKGVCTEFFSKLENVGSNRYLRVY
jgi:hypothetical protein